MIGNIKFKNIVIKFTLELKRIMSNNNLKSKPNISAIAFWDVNFENIDFDKSIVFVIEKVFNYGTWNDMIEILRFYGLEKIKRSIVEVSYFKGPALSFLSLILELNEKDFIAYQLRQSRTSNWEY